MAPVLLRKEVLLIEVQAVEQETVGRSEARALLLEAINRIEVLHREAATTDHREAAAEVVEAIEARAAVPLEALVAR